MNVNFITRPLIFVFFFGFTVISRAHGTGHGAECPSLDSSKLKRAEFEADQSQVPTQAQEIVRLKGIVQSLMQVSSFVLPPDYYSFTLSPFWLRFVDC